MRIIKEALLFIMVVGFLFSLIGCSGQKKDVVFTIVFSESDGKKVSGLFYK